MASVSLHPHPIIVAQLGRRLVRRADPTTATPLRSSWWQKRADVNLGESDTDNCAERFRSPTECYGSKQRLAVGSSESAACRRKLRPQELPERSWTIVSAPS